MRIAFIFSTVLISFVSRAQIDSTNLPKEERQFLSWFLNTHEFERPGNLYVQIDAIRFDEMLQDSHYDYYGLPIKDSTLIRKEILLNRYTRFNNDLTSKYRFLTKKEIELLDAKLKKKNKKQYASFCAMTRPILLPDSLIWIYVEDFCGPECGAGTWFLYKKQNDGYKLLKSDLTWIAIIRQLTIGLPPA